jgi:hypothetical protein
VEPEPPARDVAVCVTLANAVGTAHALEVAGPSQRARDDLLQRQVEPDREIELTGSAAGEQEAAFHDDNRGRRQIDYAFRPGIPLPVRDPYADLSCERAPDGGEDLREDAAVVEAVAVVAECLVRLGVALGCRTRELVALDEHDRDPSGDKAGP